MEASGAYDAHGSTTAMRDSVGCAGFDEPPKVAFTLRVKAGKGYV